MSATDTETPTGRVVLTADEFRVLADFRRAIEEGHTEGGSVFLPRDVVARFTRLYDRVMHGEPVEGGPECWSGIFP